ncbi:cadherin domain-containing protein [Candidatus Palauibacter sp.]|uniref:cadherin domain-containing protein n=1 Tax=Candidatus Palauibacter sp. TaxID=3101350 RepID=UPI003B59653C
MTLSAPPGGTVAEGATGHFEVSVEGSTADGAVKVKYSVSGTAVSGEDYKALSGEATVAKGESTVRIALEALDDGILDKGETVVLALTGATGPGTVIVDGTAATAMIADEGTVTIALAAVSDTIGEGSAWRSAVTMSTPVADRVSIRWWTSDGTAVAGRDYVAADEVVSFQPGETTKPVEVRTLQDDNAEPVETFQVSVGPPGGLSGASGGFNFAGAQSAFIECSVDFSPPDPRVFMLTLDVKNGKFIPVKAGTVIGTVSANTTDGIPYYELGGADKNKFSINSLTAEITAAVALAADLYDLEVTVHDECGAQASVDVSVLVKQPNRSPAGETMPPDSVDVGKTKTVDASNYFSDPDDDKLTYKAGSSDVTVLSVSVSGSKVTYTGKAEGSATVTVTAEDPDGLSASQSFQVKVKKPNAPPVANAGLDQVVTGPITVKLDGSKSYDPEGGKLEYEWTGALGAPDLSNPKTTKPSFRAEAVTDTTEYEFTLTVTDEPGLSDTDGVIITVLPQPPACKITVENGDFTVPENERVVGEVGVTAEHCGPLDYELNGAGKEDVSVAAVSGNDPNAEITGNFDYEHRELYDLTLTVSERNGSASGTGSVDIEVTNVNEQPTVDNEITDQTLYVGERPNEEVIELSDVFSDPDGDPLTYTAKSSNTAVATATVDGSTLTVTANGKGETTVTVTATDPGGLAAVDAFDVEVPNRVPEVENAIPDQRLYVGDPPNKADIELSEVFGDPDGDKLGYTAKSSDPTVATATVSGTKLTVTATGKGRARVTVTADDRMGGITEDVFEVRVPNRKPKPKGTIPDDAIDVGESGSVDVLSKFEDPDGDDLDFSAVSSNKTVLGVSVSGSKVTYEGLKAGSATVTVTAEDTGGMTATQRFDVEVYEPTRPCKIRVSAAALSVAENARVGTAMNRDVSVTASDCGTLRYALKGTGSADFSVSAAGAGDDNARIKVSRVPNHEARDSYSLKLTVSSGSVSDTRDVDISVIDVNEAPQSVQTIRAQTVWVGQPVSVNVTGYFTDEDAGDRLTFESKSSATGRLTVNASGSPVRLTGVAAGSAVVTVTARDRGGLTATQTFSVTVKRATTTQCGITVSDGGLSVPEDADTGDGVDGKLGVTTTGSCGTLSYSLSGSGSGDFSVSAVSASDKDAKVKVAAPLNHEGRDAYDLTLTVSEVGGTASDAADVDISVTDVNEAPQPIGTISEQRVQVGDPISVNVTGYFTDEDAGDRLTFESKSSATGRLTVNAKGSPVTLTGVAAGSATVTVTAEDRGGLTATQTFSVTVVPRTTECAITVSKGALSVPEDAGRGDGVDGKVGVTATGACGTLSYALSGTGSGNFTVAAAGSGDDDAKLKVAGTLDHETTASYALKLRVSSGTVSAEGDVSITVTDVNEAPEIDSAIPAQGVVTGKSESVVVSSHFSDPDGDDLTYLASSSTRNVAAVSVNGATVVVRGVAKGSAEVTVTARDPSGLEAKQAFSVTVTDPPPTNGAPKIESAIPAQEVVAGESVTVAVSSHFSDPDNDVLTYLAESLDETVATVSVNGDKVVVRGVAKGSVEVEVTARDPHAEEISQRFSVTVKPANAAPVAASEIPAMTVAAGESKTVDVSAHFRDPDGDALEYEASSSNEAAATVGVEGSELKVTGVLRGESRVTVTARDPQGAEASQSFLVTVPNEAPERVGAIADLTLSKGDTGSVRVSAHFSDVESDPLTYRASSSNAGVLSVTVAGEHVSYEALKVGTSKVTVTADDGHGGTADQEFGVTVKPENAAPVIVRAMAAITVEADSMAVVDAAPHFRDPDGDALSYEASSSDEAVAKVAVSGSEVTVTGVSRGDARVTVTALDGRGGSVPQDFAVTVPNRAPKAVGSIGPVTTYMHGRVTVGVSGAFRDPDGDKLTYRPSSSDEGVVTVEMARNVVEIRTVSRGSATVTVTADDGYGGTAEQEFEVEVPNREPISLGGIKDRTVARGESFKVGLAEYFRDFDLDKLTYTATAVSKGFASFSVEGAELTVTGVKKGSTRVDVLASDGHGGSAKQYFGLTVTNGAPSFGADGFEREVAENSAAGTAVGDPVAASDADGDAVTHAFVAGGDEALFEIDETSGQITVAAGAAFDYESEKKVYTVHVEASDGKLAARVEVTIRVTDVPAPGRPDAPVVTGGTEQVSVSWSAPSNEGPAITSYYLRYRANPDNEWTDVAALGAVLAQTITGLDAGTTYSVQVRAESSEGAGEWSESGEGTTEASNHAPVFGADAYEREVPENSAAGTAVGEPVTATDKDGDDLEYAFIAGSDEASFEIDARSGRITVAEGAALDYESEKKVYTVHVEASDGTLADRASVTIRLTDVPAPGRPDAPTVTGGEGEVSVSWSAPPNEGPAITSYDLRYRANQDNEWTKLAALGAVSVHKITGLDAGTAYFVQVRAESSEGAGKWSKSGEGTTEDAVNHAPAFGSHIHEREVAENSAPGTPVGEPVTATDEDGDDLTYAFIPSGDETSFAIEEESGQITVAAGAALDFEGGKNVYTVHLQASDGQLVDATEVKIRLTDVPAPGKPDAPTVTGGEGEVSVSWSAPSNEGPAITNYDLRYRANQDNDWTDVSGLGAALAHKITGLDAGPAYFVQVRAESSEGAGEWSESGEGTTEAANRAPAFGADAYEREVPENSAAGTAVGAPVTATDADADDLAYSFTTGGDATLFEIDAATARIAVAGGTALNYESADTLYTVNVSASDGELADTTSVTIRVTNADDPGVVTLSPAVARVGVELTAMLADEDGVKSAGRTRKWQRSRDGNSWNDIGTGRMYNPVTADEGRWLRMVFTYADRHGPNKRASSDAVKVLPANAAPKFPAVYEREVPENSPGGTAVGAPVAATDPDGTPPSYSLASGNEDGLFGIDAATGQITVADGAVLNYESGDTLYVVGVEASDGELADTASVTIRVTDADDPGVVTLSPAVARVGVELTAMLTDEDGALSAGRTRKWQRSRDGNSWNDIASGRKYTPGTNDEGRWLRAVFTYDDGHGRGKRASSEAVEVLPANTAPKFPAAHDREVPENSPGGTAVGAPVAATDPDDGASLSYAFVPGGDEALFDIDGSTGQITVAEGTVLDFESGTTLYTVKVEASDGELADTASVRIRVTNADDPGKIALSADVARVGERLAATLMDQDGSKEAGKTRRWQRSGDGGASWTNIAGARTRFYTPVAADRGNHLRAVFTYADGHGPGKRAESAAVAVVGADTPVVSFGADSYTATQGASVDVAVLLSPAGSAALSIEVVAGDAKHTVTFQAGAGTANVAVGTAGLSASDTVEVRFGDLPDGVAVGVPATTRVVVAAVAGDRAAAAVAVDGAPTELEVEFAAATYTATAGARGTEVTLRISPAADRRVAVPLTAVMDRGMTAPIVSEPVVFQPGDSLAAFTLDIPAEPPSGLLALGFGTLPEAVSAGTAASATVRIAARDDGALRDEAFDVGLAVFGRAVAEGARQAVGARIDAVMRPSPDGSAASGSPSGWAGRAAGTLASLAGVSLNPSSAAETGRRSGSPELPTGREAAARLLPSVSFATGLGPQSTQGLPRFGLWAEGSAQSFRGEPGVEYDGGLRALTVGADARIGSSTLFGVSLMRSDGDLDYGHRSVDGSLGHAMNSVHPYLFVQPSAGIGLWAMAGYGGGEVGGDDHRGDTGDASLRMLSGGVNAPLARRGAFGLALKGDAFTVGMRADDGRREGMASRARALLEASWTAGGLRLATEAGARYDGGDADTGGGAETGASVGYAGRGLDLDVRGRLALGSGRHREWGAALRLAFDPGTKGEGFRLAVSPSQGHDRSGVHGLMDGNALRSMPAAAHGQWRLDAEAGYALKTPSGGGALDSYTRLSAHGGDRAWSLGAGYQVGQTLRLGFEGSRSQMPGQQPDLGLRLALDFNF